MVLSLRHVADQPAHGMFLVGVEAVGGLVQHQHLGIVQDRLGQADAAAKALGQGFDRLVQHALKFGSGDGAFRRGLCRLARQSADPGDEMQELARASFRHRRARLRADSPASSGRRWCR